MKKLLSLIIFFSVALHVKAQPCKTVKPGMTKTEVLEKAGEPTSTYVLGVDNGVDTLILWNYGNQQVAFSGNKVDKVSANVEKQTQLIKDFMSGKITAHELEKRIDKINRKECK